MNDYTIKSGDCLWDIAKRQYGNQLKNNDDIQKAVDKLAEANNIQDSDSIFAGNTITLPDYESIFGNNIGKDSSSGSMDTEDMPLAVAADENLYEKYGFEVIDRKTAPWGSVEKIYMKNLKEKENRHADCTYAEFRRELP